MNADKKTSALMSYQNDDYVNETTRYHKCKNSPSFNAAVLLIYEFLWRQMTPLFIIVSHVLNSFEKWDLPTIRD